MRNVPPDITVGGGFHSDAHSIYHRLKLDQVVYKSCRKVWYVCDDEKNDRNMMRMSLDLV